MPFAMQPDAPLPAAANASGRELALVCRVRNRLCALPLAQVVETMRPLPIEPLAAMIPFVRGLSIIRGAPVVVVDAGALLGSSDQAMPTRFVAVRAGERSVALAVEDVLGVRDLARSEMTELPPLLRDASDELVAAVGTLDAALMVVLRTARLLPESTWQALATAVTG